jgi:hypothetical protein
MYTTIIVGNGLGMSIDSQYFKLESGLNAVTNNLSEIDQKLICFHNGKIPKSESELEEHHKVLSACKELKKHENSIDCLTDNGKCFPEVYQNFIYKVAKHFYDYNIDSKHESFNFFIDNLSRFIEKNRCHIATLNYDKLLYKALIEKKILKGYDGHLVDGIHNTSGFNRENLMRFFGKKFGWYMHLHGSPAFYTDYIEDEESINKCEPRNLPESFRFETNEHHHIVLASTKLKSSIISKSTLLDCYFDFFISALNESNRVILFGYSGSDDHVNSEVKRWLSNKNSQDICQIIEWKNNESENQKREFWKEKLYPQNARNPPLLDLISIDNILSFDFN